MGSQLKPEAREGRGQHMDRGAIVAPEPAMTIHPHPSLHDARYTIRDASRLAGTSPQNVRRWLFGYQAPGHRMAPVFGKRDQETRPLLSFVELCEVAVVAAFRRAERPVTLERLRRAHAYARSTLASEHPFASERIRTEGGRVLYDFARHEPGPGTLVLDEGGQVILPWPVVEVLQRFEYDTDERVARRWFLFGRSIPVVVDPDHGSGLPTIAGRNVRTDFIAGRFKAGESVASLAEDYELDPSTVEAALRAAAFAEAA